VEGVENLNASLEDLNPFHLEVLREVGNIGVGNAVTSLAQMLSKKVNMDVPEAGILELQDVITLIGGEEDVIVCVEQLIEGDTPAILLFILNEESAMCLTDLLLGRERGSTTSIGEMEESLLKEVGNILSGSILNALSEMTGLVFVPSVPAFAHDMMGAVLSSALIEGGYYSDKVLVVETRFFESATEIKGYFFILPQKEVVEKILSALGVG